MNDEENTEVVTAPIFGNVTVADSAALLAALDETADEGGRNGDVSYMSFSGKKGRYKIGVDGREPDKDEPFLVSVPSFELGWICWKGGKPAAKRMASISQPKVQEPDPSEFEPVEGWRDGEGWSRGRAITIRSMENGEQCYFSINSKSGVAVISDLQRDVVARMKAGQDCWPVVVWGEEEFESNGYKNSKPVAEVIAWLGDADVQKLANPEFDPMTLLQSKESEAKPAATPNRRRL